MENLKTIADLEQCLTNNGIDLTKWRIGGAKTVEDLWHELNSEEADIQIDPLHRIVSITQVIIWNDGQILVEKEQEFQSGRMRSRNRPPSEKMKPGEDPHLAAMRCLVEELEISPEEIIESNQSSLPHEKTEDSQSYPGLSTKYIIHRVDMLVRGLPDTDFYTLESKQKRADPIKRHLWGWKPPEEYGVPATTTF